MSLSDIKNNLYSKDFDEKLSERGESEFDVIGKKSGKENDKERNIVEDDWVNEKSEPDPQERKKRKIRIILTIVAVLVLIAAVIGVYQYWHSSFSEDRVPVSVSGPQDISSGKLSSFEIKYFNDNRVDLKNASLRLNFPESFKPEQDERLKIEGKTSASVDLGNIVSRTGGEFVLRGRVYSPRGSLVYIKAELVYAPSNFNSNFSARNQIAINVNSSPIELEIQAPQNLSSGDSLDYLIFYKNTGVEEISGIKMKLEYPEGFTFSSSVPASVSGNNLWNIGALAPGQEDRIVVSGKLEGSRNEIRPVKVVLGVENQGEFMAYGEAKTETRIVNSPLVISQAVNGRQSLNIHPGEFLTFNIKFKNEGDIGLRDVIIKNTLNSPVLDYEELVLRKGEFDPNAKVITWRASDVPDLKLLEPGQEGAIDFRIKVKDIIPVGKKSDKNFIVSSILKIDSPDVPTPIEMNKIIAGNRMDMKLDSKLVLEEKGYYNDPVISNGGPIPPVVGKETTYTIHWKVSNVSNDVADGRVEASLAPGVSYTGKVHPDETRLTYNERTNNIIWEIGNLESGTGILNSPKEIAFQIKLVPALHQAGRPADLMGKSVFSAEDLFTGDDLEVSVEAKNTDLREDSGIGDSRVIAE